MGSRLAFSKVTLGILVAGFILLLLVGTEGKKARTTLPSPPTGISKQMDVVGRRKHVDHPHVDFINMSKRRVPNGPDPIHNRRRSPGHRN